MFAWIRTKFGPIVVGGIVSLIAFVFIFSGVFSPKSTSGLHEGSVAGKVNGESISLQEFNRAYNQRLEFFKNIGGGKMSDAQLRAFNIRGSVFNELVTRKLMSQAAEKNGLVASDEEVRAKVMEIPSFQKDGRFDPATYRQVLTANNMTPSGFERMVREDASLQAWGTYFKSRVKVSEEEIRREFLVTRDKRNIKYVLLTTESAKKGLKVEPAEIQKYLADAAKQNLVKAQYEQRKESPEYKGMKFDDAKEKIARELVAADKGEELKKLNDKLADDVAAVMTADKGTDAKVNALLKPYGVEVKSTGLVARSSGYVPGIGEAKELVADAWAAKSPIDPAQGGKTKKYNSAMWYLVAVVSGSERADLAKLEGEREAVIGQVSQRKERELYEAWMKTLRDRAKIEENAAVVQEQQDGDTG